MTKKSEIALITEKQDAEQVTLDLFTDNINLVVAPIAADVKLPEQSENKPNAVNLHTHLGFLEEIEVPSGEDYLIDTGITFALPEEIRGNVSIQPIDVGKISLPKASGRLDKKIVKEQNIDGLAVLFHNNTDQTINMKKDQPFAQIVFHKDVEQINIQEEDALPSEHSIYFGSE